MSIYRRPLFYVLFAVLWTFAGSGAVALAAQSPQIPIAGKTIPKYVDQLPLLSIAPPNATPANNTMQTVFGNGTNNPSGDLTIRMCEFKANILPANTPGITAPGGGAWDGTTWVFGYVVGNCPTTPQDTYIGPVIVNERGAGSTNITFVNNLPAVSFDAANVLQTPNVLAFGYSTDQTMHWADPTGVTTTSGTPEFNYCYKNIQPGVLPSNALCQENYIGPIPAVPHLHGGEVPPELDGGPDAWFTNTSLQYTTGIRGHAYHSFTGASSNEAIYKYPNTQEAAPIWFHDHVLGITRLNVFAGLAGAYLIHDPALTANFPVGLDFAGLLNGCGTAPGTPCNPGDEVVEYTIPLVIQDRAFDTNGQLFYQSDSAGGVLWATNPEHPYWTPEFLGDVIVVNGKAWPNLNVEPKRYRFWLINGSNARTYELRIPNPNTGVNMPLYVIATDGGYLDAPAPVVNNKLVIMPGERYEVIIDFQGLAGTRLIMRNSAKSPYPAGAAVQGNTTGQVMQFTVGACTSGFCGPTDNSYNPATLTAIRAGADAIVRLANPVNGTLNVTPNKTRLLTLNEVMGAPVGVLDPFTGQPYPGGPLEVLVNNTKYGGRTRPGFTPVTTGNDVTYYSELPEEGSTEVWEIVNISADAHPIHLHLVQFQIINRQNFDLANYIAVYNQAFPQAIVFDPICTGQVFCPGYGPPYPPDDLTIAKTGGKYGGNPDVGGTFLKNKKQVPFLKGIAAPPLPQEAGWKDTVVAYPGQVTRLAVRWAPTDLATNALAADLYFPFDPRGTASTGEDYAHGYVWHCHIIDHEDNEMMRPFSVALNPNAPGPASRPLVKGTAY